MIQQEVAHEVNRLLRAIFTGARQSGSFDLEAVEMLVRSALHQAGTRAASIDGACNALLIPAT